MYHKSIRQVNRVESVGDFFATNWGFKTLPTGLWFSKKITMYIVVYTNSIHVFVVSVGDFLHYKVVGDFPRKSQGSLYF